MCSGLSGVRAPWARYLVLGGGKTGIDAVLHLLSHGVLEERLVCLCERHSSSLLSRR